ncbi:DUF6233 domain-containing protein [Streptomyces fructofermentans]|uniref:Uncharacterized protein n=1 Tax=Streptomyces fructofermentans TaxID=152141 RepID=A0A918U4R2_9ACTN|nr:DUF6233 domain-containing protein [Streptomyces fructofermentans]GGX93940.1 hypothetical protein GCM10010515_70980 [Streptomyces fructofermentans]
MFDDLPPDLGRLHTLRVWHTLWLQRIDDKIAAIQAREAEQERGRRRRPEPPQWIVELGIGSGRPPSEVHTGDCHIAGRRRRAITRDEARTLLASGLRACSHCRPDTALDIVDLPKCPSRPRRPRPRHLDRLCAQPSPPRSTDRHPGPPRPRPRFPSRPSPTGHP